MKTAKKVISLLLVLFLLFNLTACSTNENNYIIGAEFMNDVASLASEMHAKATVIEDNKSYQTDVGNLLSIKTIKDKKAVTATFSPLLLITIPIALLLGGFMVFPGIRFSHSGKRFLVLKVKYTNNSSNTVLFGDILSEAILKADDQYYSLSAAIEVFGGCFFGDFNTKIKPGKTKTIHLITELSKEELQRASSIEMLFRFDDTTFSYIYR